MKRACILAVLACLLTACGVPLDYNGKHYPTVGIANTQDRSEFMCYELSVGNTVWSILLVETVIAPVYFVGWSLWNPVGPKGPNGCGIDAVK